MSDVITEEDLKIQNRELMVYMIIGTIGEDHISEDQIQGVVFLAWRYVPWVQYLFSFRPTDLGPRSTELHAAITKPKMLRGRWKVIRRKGETKRVYNIVLIQKDELDTAKRFLDHMGGKRRYETLKITFKNAARKIGFLHPDRVLIWFSVIFPEYVRKGYNLTIARKHFVTDDREVVSWKKVNMNYWKNL